MRPILFELFGVRLPSYAVLMVLGYLVALAAIFFVTPKGRGDGRGGLERAQAWDLFIVMVISSVIGSKVGHVLFEAAGHKTESGAPITSLWGLLVEDPWHWARLGEPGYVWYGGMIGALATAVVYFRRRPELDAWTYSDAFAPAIMLGAAVGRFGCFLAGCCHGRPSDVPWAVLFPQLDAPVHPTQLYDSLAALMVGVFLLWRFFRRRFAGEVIALLLLAYPLLRAATEHFRGDAERGALGPLSTSQALSVPLFLVGAWIHHRRSTRAVEVDGARAA
jgi:phosphatidylglycerol:prolipoprotein diacylglycerol transferase